MSEGYLETDLGSFGDKIQLNIKIVNTSLIHVH